MEKIEWWQSPVVPAAFCGTMVLVLGYAVCGRSKPEPVVVVAPPPRHVEAPPPAVTVELPTATSPRREAAPGIPLWHTKADYVAASTREQLDKATQLVVEGDREAFAQYVEHTPGVVMLRAGIEVTVVDSGGMLSSVVKLRQRGTLTEFWTVREAIER